MHPLSSLRPHAHTERQHGAQVSGGNAERNGKILVGDKLIATSAVMLDKSNQPYLSLGGDGGVFYRSKVQRAASEHPFSSSNHVVISYCRVRRQIGSVR